MSKDNIILIGFMGSGKTTVGKKMADICGRSFVDTDMLIEKKLGMSIPEIFEKLGEDAFREAETAVTEEMKGYRNTVFACGGGMPLKEENAANLKAAGRIAFLDAPEEVIIERLKGQTGRPLLNCEDPEEKIKELLKERRGRYEASADVIVETGRKDPVTVAMAVFREFQRSGKY